MVEQPPEQSHLGAVAQSMVGGLNALAVVLDAAETGVVVVDSDSTVQYVDARVERFFGVSGADTVGVDRTTLFESHLAPTLARPDRVTERDWSAGPSESGNSRYHVTDGDGRTERWVSHHYHSIDNGPLAGGHVEQFVDVTDEATVARLQRHERIVEDIDDGVFIVDGDGVLEYANRSALKSADASPDEIEGRSVLEITRAMVSSDEAVSRLVEALEAVLNDDATPSPVELELRVDLSTGPATLRYRFSPLSTDDGRKAVVTVRDVSEHKERQRRYETLARNFPNGAVTLVDTDLRYQLAHGELFDSLSETPADFEGSKVSDVGPGEREEITQAYRDALAGDTVTFETSVGDSILTLRTRPVYDDDGTVRAAIGVTQDVTERVERERELHRKSRAIEEAPVGITITDPKREGNPLTVVNSTFLDITGYEREAVVGRNCRLLQGEGTDEEMVATLRREIDAERPVSVELRNYRADGTEFWNHLEIAPVYDEAGELLNYVGFQRDVTERKYRERELEKRQRVLHELHDATRTFHPPTSEDDIAEFVVSFLARAFGFEYVSVKRFDETDGVLVPAAGSAAAERDTEMFGTVAPENNPIWDSFRASETRVLDCEAVAEFTDVSDYDCDELVLVPIGDFGVTVVCTSGQQIVDDVEVDLIEVVTANAESAFKRLRSERSQSDLAAELSNQRELVADLQSVIDAVQAIQRRAADSESRDALEAGVCDELLKTERVDFAWIGRPKGSDTELSPTAWAGNGKSYLLGGAGDDRPSSLHAQRAVADREQYTVPSIPSRVVEEEWAKDALSAGFKSAISVPLVYDDVLYGVLTAYSETEDAFGPVYGNLLEDAASLLVNYNRIIEHRYTDVARERTKLEFDLTDDRYPLQRLATAADATIRYLTVAESRSESVRCLVAVEDASVEHVLDEAEGIVGIVDAEPFGDTDNGQLSVTVLAPFLPLLVAKHGGTLVEAVSDAEKTRILVEVPTTNTRRPLLDAIVSRYDDIELVAQRQATSTNEMMPTLEDVLTDRQQEILSAAYHGGYYESPRGVTGEDLAESFEISSPAIYNHLQAAHRSLLEPLLTSDSDSQF